VQKPLTNIRMQAIALFEYSAFHDDELSLEPNATIRVLDKHPSGWWKVR